ncbi:MAG: MerR family transcriptional regulator [Clostridiales Family XIII bacterium]|jgi:DNA-binding transcriptional MerR regulator|nr:MerR family transcriptional regulator [Clostridiales Family XIII bacterium]
MLYKIGEIAEILGVTRDTLRYYEKRGLVKPIKDAENDYRYYDFWDVNFLLDCIWYRAFDFSLEQVADIFKMESHRDISDLFREKEDEYRAVIRRNELLLERSEHQRAEIARIERLLGKCVIAMCPAHILYFNRYTEDFANSPQLNRLSREWLGLMPFTHRYFEISMDDLLGEAGRDYRWGLELSSYYAEKLRVKIEPPIEYRPSVQCVRSVFKNIGKGNFSPRHMHYMVDYAKDNGLRICGDASGILLAGVMENGDFAGYFEAWLPVE